MVHVQIDRFLPITSWKVTPKTAKVSMSMALNAADKTKTATKRGKEDAGKRRGKRREEMGVFVCVCVWGGGGGGGRRRRRSEKEKKPPSRTRDNHTE